MHTLCIDPAALRCRRRSGRGRLSRCARVLAVAGAVALLGATQSEVVQPVFAPREGTLLGKEVRSSTSWSSESIKRFIDGTELEGDAEEYGRRTEILAVFTDTYVSMADDRPQVVRRHYDELTKERSETSNLSEEGESTFSSPLEGQTVTFEWDDEAGAFQARCDSELELPDGLREDTDFRFLLPGEQVQPGETWELDPDLIVHTLLKDLGGRGLGFESETTGPSDFDRAAEAQVEGAIVAVWKAVGVHEGVELSVIALHGSLRTGFDEELEQAEGPPKREALEVAYKFEGHLIWNCEANHFQSFELKGQMKARKILVAPRRHGEGWVAEGLELDIAGEFELSSTAKIP